ncbi:MAG: hypothetical protein WC712_04945 [Candidatus Brocadiia bacterium]
MRAIRLTVIGLFVICIAVACGGGGGTTTVEPTSTPSSSSSISPTPSGSVSPTATPTGSHTPTPTPTPTATPSTGPTPVPTITDTIVVFGYNDLGMHCMNEDFSKIMVLPPYNTMHATVIQRGPEPSFLMSGITVSYEIPNNTRSDNKTNFWTYAAAIFGHTVPVNIGLAGNGLTGTMTSLASSGRNDWSVVGVPITPLDDNMTENPYQLCKITVRKGLYEKAETQAVMPVSWEISCQLCHGSPGVAPDVDILRRHDTMHGTTLENSTPVMCGACHAQAPLGTTGSPSLSHAMHSAHASRMAPVSTLEVSCYACHPGIRTKCMRDVHYSAGKNCLYCHGDMAAVGSTARSPWVTEPTCGSCHARAGFEYEQPGVLYRDSKGHNGVHCSACHGSPHAITPTVVAADNLQAITIQGYSGAISNCVVCHKGTPGDGFNHTLGEGGGEDKPLNAGAGSDPIDMLVVLLLLAGVAASATGMSLGTRRA